MKYNIHCLLTPLPLIFFIAVLLRANLHLESKHGLYRAPPSPHLQRGVLNNLLHKQRLSHKALHSAAFQVHLASLFTPRTAAIVGVEWGGDVRALAAAGFRVHAVEPGARYRKGLQETLNGNKGWNVVLHAFAAANATRDDVDITYQSATVARGVAARRLDDAIDEPLAVLSVDVQGGEYGVLQGASRLLGPRVASVWVELGACNNGSLGVLQILDRDYALFDFVPWGQRRAPVSTGGDAAGDVENGGTNARPAARDLLNDARNYAVDEARPAGIKAYWEWMCERQRKEFMWLQTDVLAVHRDLVAVAFRSLERLGEGACDLPGVDCVLRSLRERELEVAAAQKGTEGVASNV